jgi:hypothetical protein
VYANRKVTSITEPTTTYTTAVSISEKEFNSINTTIYPNPASDMVLIQADGLLKYDLNLELIDISGKVLMQTTLLKGSTIGYFDTQTLYNGIYFIKLKNGKLSSTKKVVIQH